MFALLMMASLAVFAQTDKYDFKNLVGKWRTSSGAGLDVVDSNTIYIVHGDQRKLANISLADFSRNPASLNLNVKEPAKAVTLKSLLLFVNDITLQWQVFDTEVKPASFGNTRSDMLFLKKIEELNN